ncbi:MAG: ABC transporter ATP-binding protein [Rothia sp. (in: high G+C Gram-positive bacteria)]|uniref:ABC transporter ATP-binding protein n=1 Tax=Rothia sp. (in: high G+C Gram-positive bacteria) TaxID=1885016 RepID=UPI0026DB6492|nr:ABC transporter ATP-binding protein [Rothia sp. (in: high G+C Gram-positive bacteria)]MDO4883995.1 ABC transporter ATP-binding protein [Rothia sp. (in: high G+C Gram-positive bacteria)]
MKDTYYKLKAFFPGKKFRLLMLNLAGLFAVSLLEMLGVAAVLPIVNLAMGAPIEGYLKQVAELFGNPDRTTLIIIFGLVLVLAFILKGAFSLIIKRWSLGFVATQQSTTSVNLLNRYMREPYLAHRKRGTANILVSVNDYAHQAYAAFVNGVLNFIGELLSIAVLMVMLLVIMPIPALLAFSYFGLVSYGLQHMLRKKNREQGAIVVEATRGATNATLDAIEGFREIRMHNVTDWYLYRYQAKRMDAVNASMRSTFLQDFPKYTLEIIFIIGIAGLLAFMSITSGAQSAPYLLLFCGACIRILPSYTRMVASLGNIRSGEKSSNELLREISEMDEQGRKLQMPSAPAVPKNPEYVNKTIEPVRIQLENLTFSYPDSDSPVLKNINLDIPMGTSVAFVGGSGSGKTTLIDLILGLFAPSSGRVLRNGKPVQDDLPGWFQSIGYVPQDVFIADSTVLEAVAFGLEPHEIDEERVRYCLEVAELTEVVESLDEGIMTMIGHNAVRLSGGQRQRLGIARALYRNPSVLIMDEATSALDNETEHKITKAIEKISKDITVIIVAHRLSTVRHVDQLVYLSHGEIVSCGTFTEVQQQNEEFANLVRLGQLPE